MVKREAYFRIRALRQPVVPVKSKAVSKDAVKQSAKSDKPNPVVISPEAKKDAESRHCVGHLGSALGAINKDGRPYSCEWGKDCTFVHVSVSGKAKSRLMDIVGSLPAGPRADLMRELEKRP